MSGKYFNILELDRVGVSFYLSPSCFSLVISDDFVSLGLLYTMESCAIRSPALNRGIA